MIPKANVPKPTIINRINSNRIGFFIGATGVAGSDNMAVSILVGEFDLLLKNPNFCTSLLKKCLEFLLLSDVTGGQYTEMISRAARVVNLKPGQTGKPGQ